MLEPRTAYVSPPAGELDITLVRDARPCVHITLDLGIPNFTVFSIKFPLVQGETRAMVELVNEALGALLDDVTAFMLSLKFEEAICTLIYSCVLNCFRNMSLESESQADATGAGIDHFIDTYTGKFLIPLAFVDETFEKVITAAAVIHRLPATRKLELIPMVPPKNQLSEAARVIRLFRNKTLSQQPRPLYVVLYDQKGRGVGVLPVPKFKSQLLRPTPKR